MRTGGKNVRTKLHGCFWGLFLPVAVWAHHGTATLQERPPEPGFFLLPYWVWILLLPLAFGVVLAGFWLASVWSQRRQNSDAKAAPALRRER
jgi:hypothetical protein